MTDDVPLRKSASIEMNKDFYNIRTWSGYRMFFGDDKGKNEYLSLSVSNEELGRHIREALSLSRRVHPIEDQELSLYLKNPDRHKEWLKGTMKRFGYKTKAKMFKPMLSCYVTLRDSDIVLEPSYQRVQESWDGTGLTKEDNVIVPESCTDEELGAAARLALSRCTSKWL